MTRNLFDISAENVAPPAAHEAASSSIQPPPEKPQMDPEVPANAWTEALEQMNEYKRLRASLDDVGFGIPFTHELTPAELKHQHDDLEVKLEQSVANDELMWRYPHN